MSWKVLTVSESITDGDFTTKEIQLYDGKLDHGLEFVVTGAGTVVITPYTSISGRDWISNGAKISGFGSSSGPGSDGKQIIPLLLKPSELVRFVFTATGTIIITSWFAQK